MIAELISNSKKKYGKLAFHTLYFRFEEINDDINKKQIGSLVSGLIKQENIPNFTLNLKGKITGDICNDLVNLIENSLLEKLDVSYKKASITTSEIDRIRTSITKSARIKAIAIRSFQMHEHTEEILNKNGGNCSFRYQEM